METNLIQTQLHLPPVSSDRVERPSLIQRLQQNPNRHFTLVAMHVSMIWNRWLCKMALFA